MLAQNGQANQNNMQGGQISQFENSPAEESQVAEPMDMVHPFMHLQ